MVVTAIDKEQLLSKMDKGRWSDGATTILVDYRQ